MGSGAALQAGKWDPGVLQGGQRWGYFRLNLKQQSASPSLSSGSRARQQDLVTLAPWRRGWQVEKTAPKLPWQCVCPCGMDNSLPRLPHPSALKGSWVGAKIQRGCGIGKRYRMLGTWRDSRVSVEWTGNGYYN